MASFVMRPTVCRILGRSSLGLLRRHFSSVNEIKSPFPDVDIPNCSLPEFVLDKISPFSNKIAFECSVTGRSYTFDDVKIKSKNFNRALRKKLNLHTNDVVCVLLPNAPEFPIVVLGILLAGMRVTPMNPIYTPDEIKKQLKDSGAKLIVTMSHLYPTVKTALGDSNIKIVTINDEPNTSSPEGTINFKELADNKLDVQDVHINNCHLPAVMPYSSGTTGLPKGVLLSHHNIVSNLKQIGSDNFNILLDTTESHQDIIPAVLPMFHIYGFTSICFAAMVAGSKVVTLPKFTPDLYLKVLIDYKPSVLFLVPPIVIFLNAHPAVKTENLATVRTIISGAAPLGALDEQKFKEKAASNVNVLQGYGLSEASPVVTMVPHTQGPRPGSTGCVMPNTTVKIVPVGQPNAEALGPNQTGELLAKGPQVMSGYHNRPEETAETLVDGWLHTGDMFYYDEDGSFFVADRIKELIKVKGFQVPPAELEEIIRDFPNVGDAAVIGIPHETHGEVPRAYVIPKANSKIDIPKLEQFISEKVADYKKIRGGICVTDNIPKNASGKILRRMLKQQYEEEQTQ